MILSSDFEALRHADIYVLDQLLKGRFQPGQKVLDFGCGSGRNLIALEQCGLEVFGVDLSPNAIHQCSLNLETYKADRFFEGNLLDHPYPDLTFDVVIANALFHFAPDRESFLLWVRHTWAALKPGGLYFVRLSTRIGLPDARPPGFSYLATEDDLLGLEEEWGATRIEPLKTTLVESLRTMTTWVLRK